MIIFVLGQARSNTCRAGMPTPRCRGPTVFVPLPPLGEHRGGPPEARAGTASGRRQLCWFPSPSAPFESKSHFHVIVPHKRGMRSSERLRPGTSPARCHIVCRGKGILTLSPGPAPAWVFLISSCLALRSRCAQQCHGRIFHSSRISPLLCLLAAFGRRLSASMASIPDPPIPCSCQSRH